MAGTLSNPSEIARETLKQLALRRMTPTPDNYHTIYCEIAGQQREEEFPDKALRQIAQALPRKTQEQTRFARALESASTDRNWDTLRHTLLDFSQKHAGEPLPWATLIRDLITQFDARTTGLTQAKKRESLELLLAPMPAPDLLFQRLQNVVRNWTQQGSTPATASEAEPTEAAVAAVAAVATTSADSSDLQQLVAQLLEDAVAGLLQDSPDLVSEARTLATAIRATRDPGKLADTTARLKKFSYRLHFAVEDQSEFKGALLHLLQLIIENISDLVIDDQWLHGQVDTVAAIIAKPLDLRTLDDVERRLKDVIYKQSTLKKGLDDAQNRLRLMLATFVDRLGDFTEATSGYHDKIERCADKISHAKDIAELTDVLDVVMRETREIQMNASKSRDEMRDMRRRVEEAEAEVGRLQTELTQTSDMVRMDALTGALNRRGMDEALEREVARTRRHEGIMSVALLDIDNFKQLNDQLGHQAGDTALQHLAQVTRDTIRPQDTLARYGGEEFVVILPETQLTDAIKAMERVQRELTRKFFLHDNNKVLITFSCGVAEMAAEETPEAAIERADKAMYLAKRAGKNRVLGA